MARPPSVKSILKNSKSIVPNPQAKIAGDFVLPNVSNVQDAVRKDSRSPFTDGSVLFMADGIIAEDNFNLFWDDTRKELQPNLIKITNDGSQADPALKFNDTNTGFFKSGDSVRFSLNNSTKMTIDGTGVGIGTASPRGNLHIDSTVSVENMLEISRSNTNTAIKWLNYNGAWQTFLLQTTFNNWTSTAQAMSIKASNGIVGVGYHNLSTATARLSVAGNVGILTMTPQSALDVNGAITSATSTFSTAGPTDNVDVSGINTLFVNSASNNVIIGGFSGGVDGQVLRVVRISALNNVTIEHNEAEAAQPILLHKGSDEMLDAHFGGWTFVCHGGVDWHDTSHAKHV